MSLGERLMALLQDAFEAGILSPETVRAVQAAAGVVEKVQSEADVACTMGTVADACSIPSAAGCC